MNTSVLDTNPVHETSSGLPWPAVFALALAVECSLIFLVLGMNARPTPAPAPVRTMKIVTIAEAPGEPDKAPPAPPPSSPPRPHPPTPAQTKPAAPRATAQPKLPAPAAAPETNAAPTPDSTHDTPASPTASAPAPKSPTPAAPDKPSGVRRRIVPLVRIEPDYPARALANNTEGLVVAHVTIEKDGSVSAVSIVRAQPPHIFDQEAIRALLRWKFSPNDGGTVGEVELRFSLND
jgi:protein TonB